MKTKTMQVKETNKTTTYTFLPRKRSDGVVAVAASYRKNGKTYRY